MAPLHGLCSVAVRSWPNARRTFFGLHASPKQYFERYLDNPKVSGNLLVGVRWARADENTAAPGKFDPGNVHLVVPARLPARTACVEVNSKDGRYSAENLYAVPPDVAREPALYAGTSSTKDRLKKKIQHRQHRGADP